MCDCVLSFVAFQNLTSWCVQCILGEWGKKRLKKFAKVWIFFIEKFDFVKHLKSWPYISYHKDSFSNVFAKKFSRFFKFSIFSGFDRSSLFFNRLNRQKENLVFKLKLSSLRSVEHIFMWISIPPKFQISNFEFLKQIGIRSSF